MFAIKGNGSKTNYFTNTCSKLQLKQQIKVLQKQPPEVFYQKSCFQKFHKIHKDVRRSLFLNKVVGMRPVGKQENRFKSATLSKERSPTLQMNSNEFLTCSQMKVFQHTFFSSTLLAAASGRYQSVVFITNFKKQPTVLLISLLLIWSKIYYAKKEESHIASVVFCFKSIFIKPRTLFSTLIDLCAVLVILINRLTGVTMLIHNDVNFIQSTLKKPFEFLSLKIHSQRLYTSFFHSLVARFCPLPLRFVKNRLATFRF